MTKKADKSRGAIVEFPESERMDDITKSLASILASFEQSAAEIRANPNADGWTRLCEILEEAKEDDRVKSSPGASRFLELMYLMAENSFTASSAEEALEELVPILISENARDMVNKRFDPYEETKEWMVSEWDKYKADYKNNKSAFARDYVRRIKNERGLKITERTISGKWLKGH